MMVADIKPLKEDTLDEISRIMTDVTRRLDLGRTDEDVKNQEQKIIDKLSKLIDKIQQQQQQQQQQQSGGGSQGNANPDGNSSPMDDSRIAGANGAGDVDRKKIDEVQAFYRDLWAKTLALHDAGVPAEEAASQIDMTNHSANYPQIQGVGVDRRAVRRMYELMDEQQ